MKESMRMYDSGRCTAPWSLRPLIFSKDETCGEVGDVLGDVEGEILVLILVVKVRRSGMVVYVCVVVLTVAVTLVLIVTATMSMVDSLCRNGIEREKS